MQFIMTKIALGSSRLHADTFIYSVLCGERAILIFMTAKDVMARWKWLSEERRSLGFCKSAFTYSGAPESLCAGTTSWLLLSHYKK